MITSVVDSRASGLIDASADAELRSAIVSLHLERGAELWGLARHLGLSPDEADDAVQEALLRTWAAMRGPQSIDRPDAWAFRALYRLAMDRHRFRRRLRLLAERIGVQPQHRSTFDHTDRVAIWDAVESLPERQRLAVYLRFRADLPYEEIGAVLGIAPPSARSHVSRALDSLRIALGEES